MIRVPTHCEHGLHPGSDRPSLQVLQMRFLGAPYAVLRSVLPSSHLEYLEHLPPPGGKEEETTGGKRQSLLAGLTRGNTILDITHARDVPVCPVGNQVNVISFDCQAISEGDGIGIGSR